MIGRSALIGLTVVLRQVARRSEYVEARAVVAVVTSPRWDRRDNVSLYEIFLGSDLQLAEAQVDITFALFCPPLDIESLGDRVDGVPACVAVE